MFVILGVPWKCMLWALRIQDAALTRAVTGFSGLEGHKDTGLVPGNELYVTLCVVHSQCATLKCCVVAAVHARYSPYHGCQ